MKTKLGIVYYFCIATLVIICYVTFTSLFTSLNVTKPVETEHKHKPGQFGGFIMELGRDNYHLEVSLGKDGLITIYTLGKDEAKVLAVEKQVITAYLYVPTKADDKFDLMPSPQTGDGDKTSRFIGKLPAKYLGDGEISIIFNILIEGQRFRARVVLTQLPQTDLSSDEEKKLYLTPGGIYTEQDIIANGKTSVSNKFKDFVPSHDLKPKKGDRICPITLTKANPKCTWVINGKEYWFCCPPCIEEFVTLAKEKPEQVKLPEEYIK